MNAMKRRRLNRGLTVDALAEKTGVPAATIYNIERGDTTQPRMTTLVALAEFFDVPAGDLVAELAGQNGQAA